MAGKVEIAVIGHVHISLGVGLADMLHFKAHTLGSAVFLVLLIQTIGDREAAIAGQAQLAVRKLAAKAYGVIVLKRLRRPQALVQATGKVGMQVVRMVRAIVCGQVVDAPGKRHLCSVRAVCNGTNGRTVAGRVVEIARKVAKAQQHIRGGTRAVGNANGQNGCAKIHDGD